MHWFLSYVVVIVSAVIGLVVLNVMYVYLRTVFVLVVESETVIIERLGRFSRVGRPGFHLRIPLIERLARRLNMQIQILKVKVESKSKDDVSVTLPLTIQWSVLVSREVDAHYRAKDPGAILEALVCDIVRAIAPTQLLDEIFTARNGIAQEVTTRLQVAMSEFGYTVHSVQLVDVHPDSGVVEAMNRINSAQRLEIAAKSEAQALKTKKLAEAEAEAERLRLFGQGVVEQQERMVAGLRKLMPGLSDGDLLAYVKQANHMATLKEMGSTSRVIIVPSGGGDSADVTNHLRNAIISGIESRDGDGSAAGTEAR